MLSSIILKTDSKSPKTLNSFLYSLGLKKLKNNPDLLRIGEWQSTKIQDIRKLKLWLQKKAFSKNPRAVLIFEAENLNLQSQNALLKILEEPPQNTYIILITFHPRSLLETIRSRCQTVSLEKSLIKSKIDKKQKTLEKLNEENILQRLNWAETEAKSNNNLRFYLENQIYLQHQMLKKNPTSKHRKNIELANQALALLRANLDSKTVLTWLSLNLVKT